MSGSGDGPADRDAARNIAERDARRVVMPGAIGPVLVQGPVEVVLDDGSVRVSERPVVALCTCGRSSCYPFCDTSHRRRSRPRRRARPGTVAGSGPGADDGLRGVGEGE